MTLAWEDRRGFTAASNARNLPELLRLLQRHEEEGGGPPHWTSHLSRVLDRRSDAQP